MSSTLTGYTGPLPLPAQPAQPQPDILNKLASHHITINYLLIGILVLVLACGGMGAYLGLRGYERLMDRAEASEKLLVQAEQQAKAADDLYQKESAQHAADRAAAEQRYADLLRTLKERNQKADTDIVKVLQPGKSDQDVYSDLKAAYKNTPVSFGMDVREDSQTGEHELAFPIPVVQQLTATKIDRDRLWDEVQNLGQQAGLKQKEYDSLSADYKALQDDRAKVAAANAQCQDTVKKYKAVAVKTKWQKIWAGTKRGAEIGGGFVLGVLAGRVMK